MERFFIFMILFSLLSISYYFTFIDAIYEWDIRKFLINTPTYFLPTFFLSILALYLGIKNYWRKVGYKVSGGYINVKSAYSKDPYINTIILINEKDKPLIVNDIIIKFGWNVHLHLSHFETPLIIKPYETHVAKYDPVSFYYFSDIHITKLNFINQKKGQILLNTNEGIITVQKIKKYWNPIIEHIKNSNFIVIEPSFTKSNEYSNIKYTIKYKTLDGESYEYYIKNYDHDIKIKESKIYKVNQMNQAELTIELQNKVISQELQWESFEVLNIEEKTQSYLKRYSRKYECSDQTFLGFFEYYKSYFFSKIKYFFKDFLRKFK